jgi:hypothetical protein
MAWSTFMYSTCSLGGGKKTKAPTFLLHITVILPLFVWEKFQKFSISTGPCHLITGTQNIPFLTTFMLGCGETPWSEFQSIQLF